MDKPPCDIIPLETGLKKRFCRNIVIESEGSCAEDDQKSDINRLEMGLTSSAERGSADLAMQIQLGLTQAEIAVRSSTEGVRSVYGRIVGLGVLGVEKPACWR